MHVIDFDHIFVCVVHDLSFFIVEKISQTDYEVIYD